MTLQLATASENTYSEIQRRRPLSEQLEFGLGAFFVIGISLICILALLFLSHNNRVATKGYELKMLQVKRAELTQQNEILSMQIADLQSLSNIENDESVQNMIKISEPLYIRGDTAVAKK